LISIRSMGVVAALASVMASTLTFAATPADSSLPSRCGIAGYGAGSGSTSASGEPAFPPVQLEIRTPFEPTAFHGGGYDYLIYELHLQNFSKAPLDLRGLEVIDASSTTNTPIAALNGPRFYEQLLSVGTDRIDEDHPLRAGQRVVAFICLAFDGSVVVPDQLSHRVLMDDGVADGPVIGTHHTLLKVLAPPVTGADWIADAGPGTLSHHRAGLFVAGGLAQISRRYAIDWKKIKKGAPFSGDARDVRSYHAYGEKVFAVADAKVFSARDGLPDNIPRTAAGFSPAVPITMETIAGNSIVLDLGEGQFAYYAHLKGGSLRVKAGDRVRRGDLLALIGNSGDAREPHLHIQVTTSPDILASEGVPYLIDLYRAKSADGNWRTLTGEFPIGDITVSFDAAPSTTEVHPEN